MNIQKIKEQLILHEGIRLFPYIDTVGKLTIGVGRNLTNVGISRAEAEMFLESDINGCIEQLDKNLPWWKNLSEVRQHVLINMCFNLGIAGLLKFTRTLNAIQWDQFDDAARFMLESKWAKQVGERAITLANMMKTGQESNG